MVERHVSLWTMSPLWAASFRKNDLASYSSLSSTCCSWSTKQMRALKEMMERWEGQRWEVFTFTFWLFFHSAALSLSLFCDIITESDFETAAPFFSISLSPLIFFPLPFLIPSPLLSSFRSLCWLVMRFVWFFVVVNLKLSTSNEFSKTGKRHKEKKSWCEKFNYVVAFFAHH